MLNKRLWIEFFPAFAIIRLLDNLKLLKLAVRVSHYNETLPKTLADGELESSFETYTDWRLILGISTILLYFTLQSETVHACNTFSMVPNHSIICCT